MTMEEGNLEGEEVMMIRAADRVKEAEAASLASIQASTDAAVKQQATSFASVFGFSNPAYTYAEDDFSPNLIQYVTKTNWMGDVTMQVPVLKKDHTLAA